MASAVLKLFPLDAFELVLIKQVGISWSLAPWFSRALILFEFSLGASIAAGLWLRRSLWLSILMLLVFSVYLGYLAATGQGDENCGCFGELIPMDATTSLIKNALFLAIGGLLLWWTAHAKRLMLPLAAAVLVVLAVPALFMYEPLPSGGGGEQVELDASFLKELSEEAHTDVDEGPRVIVVMYANCIHCKQLATLLATADFESAQRLRLLIYGSETAMGSFVSETGIQGLDFSNTSSRPLMQAIDGTFPTVLETDGQLVTAMWQGRDVNVSLLSELIE